MKKQHFIALLLTIPLSAQADFYIQRGNAPLPTVEVESTIDWRIYNTSNTVNATWPVQYRGQCNNKKDAITTAILRQPLGVNIYLPEGSRSISPDGGSTWITVNVQEQIPFNLQPAIQACNQRAQTTALEMGKPIEEVLSQDLEVETHIDYMASLGVDCQQKKGIGFHDVISYNRRVSLPVRALCKATRDPAPPPAPPRVLRSELELQEIASLGGSCKIKTSGFFVTDRAQQKVRFRFKHTNDNGQSYDLSQIFELTTDNTQYGYFNYEFNVPNKAGWENGAIHIAGLSPNFQSDPVDYQMRCHDGATNSLSIAKPPKVFMQYAVQDTVMIGNQRCPKMLRVQGKVEAGNPVSGKAIFVGNNYLSPAFDFSLAENASQNFQVLRTINWPTQMAPTLATGPVTPNNELKTMTLQQGFNITYGAEQKVMIFPRQTINLNCEIPTYTPAIQGPTQIQMVPNHTGGGGAPTGIQQVPQQTIPTLPAKPTMPTRPTEPTEPTQRVPTPGKTAVPQDSAKPQTMPPQSVPQRSQGMQQKTKEVE